MRLETATTSAVVHGLGWPSSVYSAGMSAVFFLAAAM